ncbi:MAG: hypothetical protein OXN89_01410 [Bryobacterales bacterium]|nr:hypothetical protein [Bryobacterales bacterium]
MYLHDIRDIAIGPAGEVFFVLGHPAHGFQSIHKITSDGIVHSVGGQQSFIHDFVVSHVGDIYWATYGGGAVARIDSTGGEAVYTNVGFRAHAIAIDGYGNVFLYFLASPGILGIAVVSADGVLELGSREGGWEFDGPLSTDPVPVSSVVIPYISSMASDTAGNVYFSYSANGFREDSIGVMRPTHDIAVQLDAQQPPVRFELLANNVLGWNGAPVYDGSRVVVGDETWVLSQASNGSVTAKRVEVLRLSVNPDGTFASPPNARVVSGLRAYAFAGSGQRGYDGDGGPAGVAKLSVVRGIAIAKDESVYFTDWENNRLRRVDAKTGTISTVAGTGVAGDEGLGGLAVEAQLNGPAGVAVDAEGNVFVSSGYMVLRIDSTTGVIDRFVGGGSSPYGSQATDVQILSPRGLALDGDGNLFIVDSALSSVDESAGGRVLRVDADTGVVTVVAGTGVHGIGGDSSPATEAALGYPTELAIDEFGNVYVTSSYNDYKVVRKIDADTGIITRFAGTGESGYSGDGGPATSARIDPFSLTADAEGNLLIGDGSSGTVRRVDRITGTISTLSGPCCSTVPRGAELDLGIPATEFSTSPYALGVGPSGEIYVGGFGSLDLIREAVVLELLDSSGTQPIVLQVLEGGVLGSRGKPLLDGSKISLGNRDEYRISKFIGDTAEAQIVAEYAPREVELPLPRGEVLLLHKVAAGSAEEAWEIGGTRARYGLSVSDGGRELFPELVDGDWRIAQHSVRSVVGSSDLADGTLARLTSFVGPDSLTVSPAGNLFISDSRDNRIRRLDTSGTVWTVAGNGGNGFAGDGGPAAAAQLDYPIGTALNTAGTLYFADTLNHRVRKIDSDGTITTLAGTGEAGFGGDGGRSSAALLNLPTDIAVQATGNLYVADQNNGRVRRVDPLGTITTVAGTGEWGYSGDGGPATQAHLASPRGLALDVAGNLYVADGYSHAVRRIDHMGTITTVAGTGERGYSGDGGPATQAHLASPWGLALDVAGNLYVADESNHAVRRIDHTGTITTVAGTGSDGYSGDGGPATEAQLTGPASVALDASGNLYVADRGNRRVRMVDSRGLIHTVAGTGRWKDADGVENVLASAFKLLNPIGVALSASGGFYFTDDYRVWQVNAAGSVLAVAGTGERGYSGDGGPATEGQLGWLRGLALDASGNLYVADRSNHAVRRIDAIEGTITTVAGTGERGSGGDGGPATQAQLAGPEGLALDAAGNLYVADQLNHAVRRIDVEGTITTVAGTGERGHGGDSGPAAEAQLDRPRSVAVDSSGNLYVAGSYWLRKVDASGVITTVQVDLARHRYQSISSVAADAQDGLILGLRHQILKATVSDGTLEFSAFAGTGERGFRGDVGPAGSARLSVDGQMATDSAGRVWFADPQARRIRVVEPLDAGE